MRESEVISEVVDATQRHEQRKKTSIQGSSIDTHVLGCAKAQFKGDQKTIQQMTEQSEAVNTARNDCEQQARQFQKVSLSWPDRSYEQIHVSCIRYSISNMCTSSAAQQQ